jgi:hypothetical protein
MTVLCYILYQEFEVDLHDKSQIGLYKRVSLEFDFNFEIPPGAATSDAAAGNNLAQYCNSSGGHHHLGPFLSWACTHHA